MNKKFITAQDLLEDSFRLAAQVFEDGFRPQFIIGSTSRLSCAATSTPRRQAAQTRQLALSGSARV